MWQQWTLRGDWFLPPWVKFQQFSAKMKLRVANVTCWSETTPKYRIIASDDKERLYDGFMNKKFAWVGHTIRHKAYNCLGNHQKSRGEWRRSYSTKRWCPGWPALKSLTIYCSWSGDSHSPGTSGIYNEPNKRWTPTPQWPSNRYNDASKHAVSTIDLPEEIGKCPATSELSSC